MKNLKALMLVLALVICFSLVTSPMLNVVYASEGVEATEGEGEGSEDSNPTEGDDTTPENDGGVVEPNRDQEEDPFPVDK